MVIRFTRNVDKFINYLKENIWTIEDMAAHQWNTDKYGYIVYGKMTDNRLRNTNGVKIYPNYGVHICHFDYTGNGTDPRIYCDEDEFKIHE